MSDDAESFWNEVLLITRLQTGSRLKGPSILLLCFLVSACTLGACSAGPGSPGSVPEEEIEPWGVEIPAHPEPGFALQTQVFRIPAGSERMFCTFGTFEEDLAVQTYEWFHHRVFGHHMVLRAVHEETAEDYPDGSVWDCLPNEFYVELGPSTVLFNATEEGLVRGRMSLHEDQAVMVQKGTRYFIQSHYINVTDQDVFLRDILHFGTAPLEQIQRPVGTWTLTSDDFLLPADGALDVTDECVFPRDVYVSMLMVHMHFNGTHFSSDLIDGDLAESNYFDLPLWYDEWQYYFPPLEYEPGLPIPAGSTLRYTCHYQNEMDVDLFWPDEMCVFEGMAYPLLRPYACNNSLDESSLVLEEFVFPDAE